MELYRTSGQRQMRYVVPFLLVFALLLGTALLANARHYDFRSSPYDFAKLGPTELIVEHGLTRQQAGVMKLGYVEEAAAPEVGLFGNHMFQFFGEEAFDGLDWEVEFFNYWYANLTLPELVDYLTYLEDLDRLPTKLILIQITTPNNDMGQHIINRNNELPSDLVYYAERTDATTRLAKVIVWANDVRSWVHHTFDYAGYFVGLRGSVPGDRVIDTSDCRYDETGDSVTRLLTRMPAMVQESLATLNPDSYCAKRFWEMALRHDGSRDAQWARRVPVIDANTLGLGERPSLRAGDEEKIAREMRRISEIGERNGVPVVFVIPPVYETERATIVDRILDKALEATDELNVLDHRPLRGHVEYFMRYDHPSPEYFKALMRDLEAHGFLSSPQSHLSGHDQLLMTCRNSRLAILARRSWRKTGICP